MSNKKQIGIIWANPYSGNLGVAALAYSTLSIINDVIEDNNIEAEITFFGSSKNTPERFTINDKTILVKNIKGFNFYYWKSFLKCLLFPKKMDFNNIKRLDYIFDIAEGDSFTDIYGVNRFRKILNSKKFFYKLGKHQILLPQTIGPFNNPKLEKEAFSIMKKMDYVISRDQKSYEYTRKFLSEQKTLESIDVAFYLPFKKQIFKNKTVNIGINISGLLWNGGYTKNNQFGMKTNYRKLINDILKYFTSLSSVKVHLIPHVIPSNTPVEDDYLISETLLKEYPNLILAPRFDTPIEAKSYISGLDFFTGARMHSCIAAFSSGVPVFPLAYSRKFNGLFVDTLNYSWMGDCVNDDDIQVFEQLINAFNNRVILNKEIEISLHSIVQPRLDTLKSYLENVFNSNSIKDD